jgi:hypothetical protein
LKHTRAVHRVSPDSQNQQKCGSASRLLLLSFC